ncbi:hypothetical protein CTAYLR_004317 [Chrysophaeum taylorii]|uniref:CAAX prenyl protease 2/Lysostaphin resistance protein A-like domain-containing protein n=1 Tax=Chrysophaeum taylorii TaxID=2483200 RepID=A0AAD7UFP5_9STRA|nr:hypothetical protein CTAYLR_004317 [Chrysophaeum taylorii]
MERWLLVVGCATTGIEAMLSESEAVRDWCRRLNTVVFVGAAALQGGSRETASVLIAQAILTVSSWLWLTPLPFVGLVPYPMLGAILVALVVPQGGESLRAALEPGATPAGLVFAAGLVSIATVGALWAWSVSMRRDHGILQEILGPILTPALVPAFAFLNAFVEEFEFRGLLMAALLRDTDPLGTQALVVVLQALLFAIQHYKGGFPCGPTGFVLVLVWGLVLGLFRWLAKGAFLVYLIHVVADATIGLLIYLAEKEDAAPTSEEERGRRQTPRRTTRRRRRRGRTSRPSPPDDHAFVEVWSRGS